MAVRRTPNTSQMTAESRCSWLQWYTDLEQNATAVIPKIALMVPRLEVAPRSSTPPAVACDRHPGGNGIRESDRSGSDMDDRGI